MLSLPKQTLLNEEGWHTSQSKQTALVCVEWMHFSWDH